MTTPDTLPPLADSDDYIALVGALPAGRDVDRLLAAASDKIRRAARWHIAPVMTEDVVLDGPGSGLLMVQTLNLVAVTAITNAGVIVDPTYLEWSSNGSIRWSTDQGWSSGVCNVWTPKLRGITLTIQHGFNPVPDGLVELCCTVAGRSAVSGSGILRKSIGSASVEYTADLFAAELAYAQSFRIPGRI